MKLKLDWHMINQVQVKEELTTLIAKYSDIERKVREFHICQSNRNSPAPATLHLWRYPTGPLSRIHVDHAGPVLGHTLIVMDAYLRSL